MTHGPTKGAEDVTRREWHASPVLANVIRLIAFLGPLVAAWLAIRLTSGSLYRPAGRVGLAVWVVQAALLGFVVSKCVNRVTRSLLPLASLFAMSLVFPDQAPSHFRIALRSSTIRQLRKRVVEVSADGLGASESEAAATAVGLVHALGTHDRLTRGHTERVRAYSAMIAEELDLSEDDRAKLAWGAMLHDIGKITVDPAILNKRGKPSEAEWDQLKQHPARSSEFLHPLKPWLGDWLLAASEHHERWDGTGYPLGLKGEEISLAGRITAVADAYDVITSKRSYKEPMSAQAARKELVRCAGSQFDPTVVRAFLNVSLGRQWATGPLAWLAEVPGLQLGATTVTTATPLAAATSMAAVGSAALVISASVASAPPDTLAMVDFMPPTTTVASGDAHAGLPIDEGSPATSSQPGPPTNDSSPTTQPLVPTTALADNSTLPTPTLTSTTKPRDLDSARTAGLPAVVPPTTLAPTTLAPTTLAPTSLSPTTVPSTTAPPTSLPNGSNVVSDDTVDTRQGKKTKISVFDNDDWATIQTWDFATLTIIQDPMHGEIKKLQRDHIRYKADRNYVGQDSFVYQICSYQGQCASATVTITITD